MQMRITADGFNSNLVGVAHGCCHIPSVRDPGEIRFRNLAFFMEGYAARSLDGLRPCLRVNVAMK